MQLLIPKWVVIDFDWCSEDFLRDERSILVVLVRCEPGGTNHEIY
jgi:hypothetical protein